MARLFARVLLIGIFLDGALALAQSTSLLRIHTIQIAPGAPTQFIFADQGSGATNYSVEFSPAVGGTSSWSSVNGAVITSVGGSNFLAIAPAPQGSPGFYRVRGNGGSVIASFSTTAFQMLEGGTTAAIINFSAPFFGTIRYTVSGSATSGDYVPLSGEVVVSGSTAVIPVSFNENTAIGEIRNLTLRLEPGSGYRVGTTSQSTITVDENDADWQGSFVTGKGSFGFVLKIQRAALSHEVTLRSDRFGFFPTNEIPGSLNFTDDTFNAIVPDIAMPGNATLLNSAMLLRLELNAANGLTNQEVSPTLVQGQAVLIMSVPGREYLNNTNRGTFVLLKSPVRLSTNEVQLFAKP